LEWSSVAIAPPARPRERRLDSYR